MNIWKSGWSSYMVQFYLNQSVSNPLVALLCVSCMSSQWCMAQLGEINFDWAFVLKCIPSQYFSKDSMNVSVENKIRMPLQKVVHPIAFAIPTFLKPVFVLQTRQFFRFTLTASANQLKIKKENFWWKIWEGFSFVPYYLPIWLWWNVSLRINSQVSKV